MRSSHMRGRVSGAERPAGRDGRARGARDERVGGRERGGGEHDGPGQQHGHHVGVRQAHPQGRAGCVVSSLYLSALH